MPKKKLAFLCAIVLAVCSLAYQPKPSPAATLQKQFSVELLNFEKQVSDFNDSLKKQDFKQKDLQASFLNLRLSFKKIEPLIAYLSPQDFNDYLNGAPLPKVERNAPRLVVLNPKGLQIMEELLFASADEFDRVAFGKQAKEFLFQYKQCSRSLRFQAFTDRQVFEIIRLGLVRIMSLGITGFDTPAGREDLSESLSSWTALEALCSPYLKINTNLALSQEIENLWQEGAVSLADAPSFNDFNRIDFIRQYLNPLYGKLYQLHLTLGYEFAREVYQGELAFNYESTSIFGNNFFNPAYFTAFPKEKKAATELGRKLFFDPVLSLNLKRSCASCHKPELAFSDGYPKSLAMDSATHIQRNAPSLINAIYTEKFFYDLRADRMESQIEHVIFNPDEFASNYAIIVERLNSIGEYKEAFRKSFPEQKGQINRQTLSMAISSYLASLSAFNSPVDRYLTKEEATLDAEEKLGFNLFMGKASCGTCHFAPSFSGLVPPLFEESESEVLGVFVNPDTLALDADLGRYASGVPSYEADFYKNSFKTVSVRNVKYSAPYFHNGAYSTLDEVLDFYNQGGALGRGLDLPHQTLPEDHLNLSDKEKQAIIKFMESLSDTTNTGMKPAILPASNKVEWSNRKVGGFY